MNCYYMANSILTGKVYKQLAALERAKNPYTSKRGNGVGTFLGCFDWILLIITGAITGN